MILSESVDLNDVTLGVCDFILYFTLQSDNPQEFRHWVKIRIILLLFIAPVVGIFAYIHFGLLAVSILSVITFYQFYYIWVVQYYSYELDIELETDSMGIGGDKA
jgi:hypothetical protein